MSDDDLVPVSVRLGSVVPPEDPEDWTRPLTWVVAFGMLAGPLVAFGWFVIAPPSQGVQALPSTFAVAVALAAGAAATGATQQGVARSATATLGAGLFGCLAVVVLGVVMAGERQVDVASPTLSHAVAAAVGGLGASAAAAVVAGAVARLWSGPVRFVVAVIIGIVVAVLVVAALLPAVTQV